MSGRIGSMRQTLRWVTLVAAALATIGCDRATKHVATGAQDYTIAYTHFGPLNSDIFIADREGRGAKPLLPHPSLDYNPSFSFDGRWVVFTSERGGSADIYRAHPDGSGLERLTDDPAFDDQAAPSPDGTTIAFVSSRGGNADIWLLDLRTHQLRNVTSHPAGDFRPAWSPDGRRLAFSSDRDSQHPAVQFGEGHSTEVYTIDLDGGRLQRLTHANGASGTPSWSPDGRRIVCYTAPAQEIGQLAVRATSDGSTRIVEVDTETGNSRVIADGPGAKLFPRYLGAAGVAYLDRRGDGTLRLPGDAVGATGPFHAPSWAPDGTRIVFSRDVSTAWPPFQPAFSRDPGFRLIRAGMFPQFTPDGTRLTMADTPLGVAKNSVLIMNADGASRSVLFSDPALSVLAPVWSPDGLSLAFGLGRFFPMVQGFGPADLAVLDVKTSAVRVLTDGKENVGFPSWSSDGQRLVYREWNETSSSLRIIDVASRVVTTLLRDFGRVNFPGWSPDGRLVQFTSNRDGNYELYTIDVESRRTVRLTESPGNDGHGTWSPDGQWIAFSSVRGGFKDEGAVNKGNPQSSGDLYVMRANGTEVRALTDNSFEEATPGWAPVRGAAAR